MTIRIAVPALAVLLAGCPDLGAPLAATGTEDAGDDDGSSGHTVFLRAIAFCDQDDCTDVSRIHVGDTVTWVNQDTVFHEIAYGSPDGTGTELFHSPPIQVGEQWSYTFEVAGELEYYCTNHARIMNMARIIVQAP